MSLSYPQYILDLNPEQKKASLCTEGPVMVLAGAGSGKTKMLTARIAYLMGEKKIPPYQILAVTFTNKAAQEMKNRVDHFLTQSHHTYFSPPDIGTFHAACLRILRKELLSLPFTGPFLIYDDSDQLTLIKEVMKQLDFDPKKINPKSIQGHINRFKCDALTPSEIEESNIKFQNDLKLIYTLYQKELYKNNAVDFGEIITLTYQLFLNQPLIRKKYQNLYRYIHVDEYQDTNRAQYLLLSMLTQKKNGGHENICVVGDEDQSIYSWRGADINNILDFEKDFKNAHVFKLEQNYRSTQTIIKAASTLIQNNTQRKNKVLWTDNEEGSPITQVFLQDERQEAEFVVREIKRLCEKDFYNYDDFALFYRTHAQSRQFEDALRKSKIPYQIIGGLKFYDRKEIKDILAYLRLIFNPSDAISLKRIINVPARGIGKTTLDRIQLLTYERSLQSSENVHFWDLLNEVSSSKSSLFGTKTREKLQHFIKIIEKLRDSYLTGTTTLTELYHLLLDETRYILELKREASIESLARVENLEEFDSILQEFEEDQLHDLSEPEKEKIIPSLLEKFLEQSMLNPTPEDNKIEQTHIKLMTLHSSKGLEFPVVFMVGMEDGLFPSIQAWEEGDANELEEERRLCYVGMTRARKTLFFTYSQVRRIWGQTHFQEPSRFFNELNQDLIKKISFNQPRASSDLGGSSHSHYQSTLDEVIGQMVQHPQYGQGRIVDTEGAGSHKKVTVDFKSLGRKKFLLSYLLNSGNE